MGALWSGNGGDGRGGDVVRACPLLFLLLVCSSHPRPAVASFPFLVSSVSFVPSSSSDGFVVALFSRRDVFVSPLFDVVVHSVLPLPFLLVPDRLQELKWLPIPEWQPRVRRRSWTASPLPPPPLLHLPWHSLWMVMGGVFLFLAGHRVTPGAVPQEKWTPKTTMTMTTTTKNQ